MGDTRHEIPFTISPGNGARLAVQAADGFRKAILSGYYRPGDVLPTFRELAKMLGTSIRIPIEAFKILSAEGLVVSRQGSGSVVLSPGERVWKGCVAFVSVGADASPFTNLLAAAMREQISNAGYLFVRAAVPVLPDGSYDYAALDMLLGKTVSLAILIYDYPEVARQTGLSPAQVERALRHAIDAAWRNGAIEHQHRIFGDTIDARRGKPTCGEMIAQLAEELRWEA